ncbi:monodehydroascorbate reductase [Aureococcus anophagefferens]|nr:monodehydroascorbate reductase [Aureococcus anophagefferens]
MAALTRLLAVLAAASALRINPLKAVTKLRGAKAGGAKRVVVVGNGMVGQRFVELAADKAAELGLEGDLEIVSFCEEPVAAYDRVRVGDKASAVDAAAKTGKDLDGVFVYRTVDDLERLVAYQEAHGVTAAAVVGGGLLGLEAAKAMHDLGMKTHILEYAPILMCRQIDAGGHAALASMVEDLGLEIHCDADQGLRGRRTARRGRVVHERGLGRPRRRRRVRLRESQEVHARGAGCGGCEPDVKKILAAELEKLGATVFTGLCSHFDKSAPELKALLRLDDECDTFEDVIATAPRARTAGCEACKPAVAGMLASLRNEPILDHAHLQDTNDRSLANMQRGGSYSIVPRIPAGEVTPAGLMALGAVADEYGLYCKITGAQRVDLFGAAKHDLPAIWAKLGAAGFERPRHGKALRMVKSCVGSSWCRYGVQNSVDFAVTVENRYKGLRAPHKLKSAVSGCTRECAEAQCKDFGMIATEHGYDLYVCGNGGLNPRHAALLATGIDEATVLKYVDRFLMYYVLTANKLERTAPWFESLAPTEDARLARLKAVVVDTYHDEWAEVVARPDDYAHLFKQFANTDETQAADEMIEFMDARGQRRPSTGADGEAQTNWRPDDADVFARSQKAWLGFGPVDDYPSDIGTAILYGETQLSVFKLADGQLFVTQNMCPHKQAFKTFGLADGAELGGGDLKLMTFDARVGASGDLEIHLPPREEVDAVLATPKLKVTCDKAPKQAPAFAR